jgi:hypothetical protein
LAIEELMVSMRARKMFPRLRKMRRIGIQSRVPEQ